MSATSSESYAGVIIPCFNEAERLNVQAFAGFASIAQGIELVFVDDGSFDNTLQCALEAAGMAPSAISVLRLEENTGKAEAVRQGMLWASARPFSALGFWDADLATPLETSPRFLDVLQRHPQVEAVWGTRLSLMGHTIDRDRIRRKTGRLFSVSSAMAIGVGIQDALCGAKMFRTGTNLNAILSQPFSSRWIFDVEIVARLDALLRIQRKVSIQKALYEFPLEEWYEIAGSRLRSKDFARAGVELAELALRYRLFPRGIRKQFVGAESDRFEKPAPLSPRCRVMSDASQAPKPTQRAA